MTKVSLYPTKRPIKSNPKRRVWQLRWVGTDGIRYCETLDDVAKLPKREAEAMRRDKQSKMDCGVIRSNKPERMTLAEFLRRDREAVSTSVRPSTLAELRNVANHAAAALGADFPLRRFDEAAADRIKAHLHKQELAVATICAIVRRLQGSFRRGMRRGLVPSNPFKGIQLPKAQPKPVAIFQPEEVAALIEVAPDTWWEALIRVAYTTGLRAAEMFNLCWENVDLDKCVVRVDAKRAGEFTVGDRTYPILAWSSKTYESRIVPIPPETVDVLRRMQARSGGSVYVFVSLKRLDEISRWTTRNKVYKMIPNVYREWKPIQDDAAAHLSEVKGEPWKWDYRGIHAFRRSYGTRMAYHVPLHELRKLMGHSSINTTANYYLAPSDDLSAKVASAFSSMAAVAG